MADKAGVAPHVKAGMNHVNLTGIVGAVLAALPATARRHAGGGVAEVFSPVCEPVAAP